MNNWPWRHPRLSPETLAVGFFLTAVGSIVILINSASKPRSAPITPPSNPAASKSESRQAPRPPQQPARTGYSQAEMDVWYNQCIAELKADNADAQRAAQKQARDRRSAFLATQKTREKASSSTISSTGDVVASPTTPYVHAVGLLYKGVTIYISGKREFRPSLYGTIERLVTERDPDTGERQALVYIRYAQSGNVEPKLRSWFVSCDLFWVRTDDPVLTRNGLHF